MVLSDAAAGSGIQLIAFSKILKRPALAVEIEEDVAKLCTQICASIRREMSNDLDRVLVGDGCSAESGFQHTGLV